MEITNRNQVTQQGKEKDETAPMIQTIKEDIPKIQLLTVFRDTSSKERFLMIIGICGALASGTGLPLFSLVFGNMTNSLGPSPSGKSDLVDQAAIQSAYFVYIGLGIFVCLSLAMAIYLSLCEKLTCRLRKKYFSSLLKQEIGWFDILNPNELAGKIALDTQTVSKGIGENIPTFFMSSATVIGGFIMGFARGWELLALVLLGELPFIALGGGLFAYILTSVKHLVDIAYVHASGMAEQSLNAIKTVKALSSEEFELGHFNVELKKGIEIVNKFGISAGAAIGFLF